jgi:5'-methylthioadenosine phosphorylase
LIFINIKENKTVSNFSLRQRTGEIPVMDTPYGRPSDVLIEGNIQGIPCILLSRFVAHQNWTASHRKPRKCPVSRDGRRHHISPTNINYRANIWAMKKAGVGMIIAVNACGSLREELAPGHMVVLDSFIDRFLRILHLL